MGRRWSFALLAAVVVAPAATARADWTAPQVVPGARAGTLGASALAAGGRGRAAFAWVDDGGAGNGLRHATATLRVAVRGANGPLSTHTLVRRRDLAIGGMTAAMDARGELTVAWIDALPRGHRVVRAASRTRVGRWSAVQRVGLSSAFAYAVPRLAVAPDGRVVLSYVAGVRAAPGVAVAWRRPGHRFGAPDGVGRLRIFDPVPAFDPAGRTYLSGITDCDNESASRGVVRVTAPGGRRFGPVVTVAAAPATELRLQVTGSGRASAAWVGAGCSTTELLAGAIRVATLRGGAVAGGGVAYASAGRALVLSGAPAGAAELSFTAFPATALGGAVLAARLDAVGAIGPAAPPADGWTALAADRAGDQVVAQRRPEGSGPPLALGAREAGGDAVVPAPLAGPAWFAYAGSTTGGRALAAASAVAGTMRIATWTPRR